MFIFFYVYLFHESIDMKYIITLIHVYVADCQMVSTVAFQVQ